MNEENMLKWAEELPWNSDVSERYYYTMSKMMDQEVRIYLFVLSVVGCLQFVEHNYIVTSPDKMLIVAP